MRARDLESLIKARGFEAGVLYALQELIQAQKAQEQGLMECAATIDQFSDLVTTVAISVGNTVPVAKKRTVANAVDSILGKDIDAPHVNMVDKHDDVGIETDPDKRDTET